MSWRDCQGRKRPRVNREGITPLVINCCLSANAEITIQSGFGTEQRPHALPPKNSIARERFGNYSLETVLFRTLLRRGSSHIQERSGGIESQQETEIELLSEIEATEVQETMLLSHGAQANI
jgi:hypothetical protein